MLLFGKEKELEIAIDMFASGTDFLESFKKGLYTLVFLDIFMDGKPLPYQAVEKALSETFYKNSLPKSKSSGLPLLLFFHALRFFLSITLQNNTPASVLTAVATMAGPTIAVGFTLPY